MEKDHSKTNEGELVISLDFEMFWGMADVTKVADMAPVMKNVHNVVPRLLTLFEKYNIHATWATVGALMADGSDDFLRYLPDNLPRQTRQMLEKMGIVPENKEEMCPRDILFAPELVKAVADTEGQEIGTHTYSHYYCSEKDSKPEEYAAEIGAALKMAGAKGYEIDSAVFPRNQVADEYLEAMSGEKRLAFRGNESGMICEMRAKKPKLGTLLWYVDNYIPLQKRTSYKLKDILDRGMLNIRSSRFFKPFRPKYSFAEKLKLRRYKKEMLKAAKKGEIYHMYWHPHNFAVDTEVNFTQMEELLAYYSELRRKYGMKSMNMREVAEQYRKTCEVN